MSARPQLSRRPVAEPAAAPRPALFVAVYAIHLLDEGLVQGGLAAWSTRNGFHFSIENWVFVNVVSMLVVTTAMLQVARGRWPSWLLVSMAVHLLLHAAIHVVATVLWQSLSPGAVSGVLVAAPLAFVTLRWGWRSLDSRSLILGSLVGVLSFQAPWDLLVRVLFGLPLWSAP